MPPLFFIFRRLFNVDSQLESMDPFFPNILEPVDMYFFVSNSSIVKFLSFIHKFFI